MSLSTQTVPSQVDGLISDTACDVLSLKSSITDTLGVWWSQGHESHWTVTKGDCDVKSGISRVYGLE